jgi:transposase
LQYQGIREFRYPGPQRRGASSCALHQRPAAHRDDEALARDATWPRSTRCPLAEAIRYALARWPALTRFLDDGRIELDNNPVERAIRPIALGRKNHLFAGSDGGGVRWATICSLIATAKLNNVEPFIWLRDVLQRMTDGHPASRLDELLPWNWQPISVKA